MTAERYDIMVAGGGLAGLTFSIQMANKGYRVVLFEKETYPFHRVCGEYISMESWGFLEGLGLPLSQMNLPRISRLIVSAPGGKELKQRLPLGGFGISRYTLDNALKDIAVRSGVQVLESCRVNDIDFRDDLFTADTTAGQFTAPLCCGSFGKRSNLDVKWKRGFIREQPNRLNQYVGVKYHINTGFDKGTIALHNFRDGYCGLSAIEDDKYCLCYLTRASNLQRAGNDIRRMETEILGCNPQLKTIFSTAEILYDSPVTISQVSFSKKSQVENHVLLMGDAAGMIAPLCGNGMSMAMHAGKIAAVLCDRFLQQQISRQQLEDQYTSEWRQQFGKRLAVGRFIQGMFGKTWVTNMFIGIMKLLPGITKMLIRQTHGKAF